MSAHVKPLLCVEQLEISYFDKKLINPIIRNVNFQLYPGEMVALKGPSGCGKSVTAHALVGMLDAKWVITNGHIYYQDQPIEKLNEKKWQQLRRHEISLLIQHSLNGLNPIRTVRKQMVETLQEKKQWSKKDVEQYLHSLLETVGFLEPDHILTSYPFELSGGMRQRILLAMMVSLRPKILIADEPTTALDVINREKVLSLLKKLQKQYNLAILLISHDEQSITKYADRVIQMHPGGVTAQ
ncbi:ATP-binding cassette domain-containing protein [Metabacillus sp. B2-18]|uniref:ATP-binding cassette domain-containing protein n=1 Tax=Metabacillus sp. B2-18 TaxID=2897333 RepID=UPI001E45EAF6|nr:ABC transporter ATP-binding protein [Metabacillus sp. B2-18]UGB32006.1 ABC transporter ATP-binding protein [Metabacillus sp. B2-18]